MLNMMMIAASIDNSKGGIFIRSWSQTARKSVSKETTIVQKTNL